MAAVATTYNNEHEYSHESASATESSEDEQGGVYHMKNESWEAAVRRDFVKKVYSILSVMLIVTTAIAAPFQTLSIDQIHANAFVLQGLLLGSLFTTLCMACCCVGFMKGYPQNYVFLAIFSILYGIIVGICAMQYTLPSVMLAFGVTACIFFGLTAFAIFTPIDFTGLGPYLYVALLGLIGFGFMNLLLSFLAPGLYTIMAQVQAVVGAILFSFYIVYDTQLIIGGRHKKCQFEVDEYAFAALSLYLDIINLFLYILSLLGDRK